MQEAGNLLGVHLQLIGASDVVGRETTAHVDHLKLDTVFFLQTLENHLHLVQGRIPGANLALLGTDVKRHAVGHQTQVTGKDQQVHGHVGLAAELAGQRPVCRQGTFGQDTHIHFRARGRLGDVAKVCLRVGGKHTNAFLVEGANVLRLLDGIAIADPLTGNTQGHHLVQLVHRRDIERGTLVAQHGQDLRGRVGFHRIVNLGVGETLDQLVVLTVNRCGVDHHKRSFLAVGKVLDALERVGFVVIGDIGVSGFGHGWCFPPQGKQA